MGSPQQAEVSISIEDLESLCETIRRQQDQLRLYLEILEELGFDQLDFADALQ